jgi:class 3 adenylate cyclase
MEAPTKTLTFVFTDLVGSTELTARLGDDAVDQLRRVHYDLLRDAVASFSGEEVKSLGDGIMAVFSSATDAVGSAVVMQQATHRHNQRSPDHLGLRVGVNTGEAVISEGDYHGLAVNITARLCALAEGGQILVSRLTSDLASAPARRRDLGDLTLRGLPAPVPTHEIEWDPIDVTLPLPGALRGRDDAVPFIGRGDSLRRLRKELDRASAGDVRLVLVRGEAGIGKSRLVAEVAGDAHALGVRVMYGRCSAVAPMPYEPWVEAFSRYAIDCSLDALRLDVGAAGAEVRRMVPVLGDRLSSLPAPLAGDPGGARHRLERAVTSVLTRLAATGPLLIVLDDVQSADAASLALLGHVVRTIEAAPVLVIATQRTFDGGVNADLTTTLSELRKDSLLEEVDLVGLDEPEAAELISHLGGRVAPHRVSQALYERTGGSPLFLSELVRHLRETGVPLDAGQRWAVPGATTLAELPAAVRDVISQRLGRLDEEATRLLRLAAVIGQEFDLDLLQAVGVGTDDTTLERLDSLVRTGLITEAIDGIGRYAFAHALVREVLYDDLTRTRRVHLHRDVGHALERQREDGHPVEASALAHHFLAAAPAGDLETALGYAALAADHAMGQVAYEEAAAHRRAALSALEASGVAGDIRAVDLLIGLGDAQRLAGDPDESRSTFLLAAEGARSLGATDQLARAARGLTSWTHAFALRAQPDEIGAELIEEALDAIGDEDSAMRAVLLAQFTFARYFSRGSSTRPPDSARTALEVARRVGDLEALGAALHAQMYVISGLQPLDALDLATEMLEVATTDEDWELVLWARSWRVHHHLILGDRSAVDAEIAAFTLLAERLQVPVYRWFTARWAATLATLEGDLEAGERLATEAYFLGEMAQQADAAALHFGAQMAIVLELRDGVDEVVLATLEDLVEKNEPLRGLRCGLAAAYAGLDREDSARALFEELAEDDFAWLPNDWDWVIAMQGLAVTAHYLHDVPRAEILYERLAHTDGWLACSGWATMCAGPMSTTLGLLATVLERWSIAEQHFAYALRTAEQFGALPYVARAQHALAAALLDRGEPERARDLAAAACSAAASMGMAPLEARASELEARALAAI